MSGSVVLTLTLSHSETAFNLNLCPSTESVTKSKIEHRIFCHITENWRGRALIDHEVIVNLIANTTTDGGLKIQAKLDKNTYLTGISISDQNFKRVNLIPAKFHGKDWNYAIKPDRQKLRKKPVIYLQVLTLPRPDAKQEAIFMALDVLPPRHRVQEPEPARM